jgi:hypothetical protein
MAIWQFECMVIPSENAEMDISSEDILLWRTKLLKTFMGNIKKILPLEKNWSEDIEQYGKIDETCIKILHEKDMAEVSVRLDLRSLSKKDFEMIIGIISETKGQILYQEKLYQPDFNEIIRLTRESDAARFCENPTEYLKSLGDEL